MTYSTDTAPSLTFGDLRLANSLRLPQFRNAKGERAHARADGSDWSLNDWCLAVLGELGEAANLLKKVRRGDMDLAAARPALADEFADVAIYLDLLAMQAGIDLGAAVVDKFNRKSRQVGATIYFEARVEGIRVIVRRPSGVALPATPPAFPPEPRANMVWLADEPGTDYGSVGEAMTEGVLNSLEVVRLGRARRLPDVFVVRVPMANDEGDLEDEETFEFTTRAMAEAFIQPMLHPAESRSADGTLPAEGGE